MQELSRAGGWTVKDAYWTIMENGKPKYIICESKKSLLISYDLMPLRGLEKTEQVLISKGMIPTEVSLCESDNDYDFWIIKKKGEIDIRGEQLASSEEEAFGTLALFEGDIPWQVFGAKSTKKNNDIKKEAIAEMRRRGFKAVKVKLIPVSQSHVENDDSHTSTSQSQKITERVEKNDKGGEDGKA